MDCATAVATLIVRVTIAKHPLAIDRLFMSLLETLVALNPIDAFGINRCPFRMRSVAIVARQTKRAKLLPEGKNPRRKIV